MTTSLIRPAAVAGSFYSSDPKVLAAEIDTMLFDASARSGHHDPGPAGAHGETGAHGGTGAHRETVPIALIVPHAGYVYSGPIAATAYAQLAPWSERITRVVVIGPPHRVAVRGVALSSASGFATPLGIVEIDGAGNAALATHRSVYVDDAAHGPEHSIEVHLPFLQRVLGNDWRLLPILVGGTPTTVVADALATVWGTPGTLVVVSTDLSHYHDAATARRLDRKTASMIVDRSWEQLRSDDACGAGSVRAALELGRRRDERVELLDLRNSGDTAGSDDRVVGYASFVMR